MTHGAQSIVTHMCSCGHNKCEGHLLSSFEDLQTELSPTLVFVELAPFLQGKISTSCTKVLSMIPKIILSDVIVYSCFLIIVVFMYETSNFSLAKLETPLWEA
jgi:hypothetical protein